MTRRRGRPGLRTKCSKARLAEFASYPLLGKLMMPPPEEDARPMAVTVIGWLWLVLGVLFLCRALVNLAVWKILQPDMLGFLAAFGEVPPTQQRMLRPLFEHLTALQTCEAILSATVIVLAIQLLRLRSWARAGMQAFCWLILVSVAAFGAFWVWLWRSVTAAVPPSHAGSFGRIGLVVGLAFWLAVASGLAVMIALLASSRVRDAFRRAPGS